MNYPSIVATSVAKQWVSRLLKQGWSKLMKVIMPMMLISAVSGCASGPKPADYANEQPKLDLATYFNGTIDAWGVFQDRSGKIVKRFTVVMTGTWNGNVGVLDEDFTYSDGTKQKRVWTITKQGDRYVGTASDVLGEADGVASGNALNWRYTMLLPVDGKTYEVQFDDWMYLMDDHTMLNRAKMSKFGFELGEVFLSFRKRH